jgi:two-component system response regulator HydG
MPRVLIADDEPSMRRILSMLLREDGHEVKEAGGVAEALHHLSAEGFDLVITDQKMRDGEGLALLASCREIDPALPVILITAFATVELAVEAMRGGAFDVLTKPFMPEAVRAVVRRACERVQLVRENERLRGEVRRFHPSEDLLGRSPALRRTVEQAERVAPTEATVLITGETGTGKELLARLIHQRSRRAAQPFVAVNCAGLPETLLESELFGHERGAFTGADRSRKGLFEAAHGGTLFLDEAGEMSLALQSKLLRVLMDGQVMRVGATAPRTVDVRLVVATHRDLEQRIQEGAFREDLYYRLAVVPLHIPPLRERREDIPVLTEHFLDLATQEMKISRRAIHPDAVERLRGYSFPGNVRELRNLVERACILATGDEIMPEDFPLAGASAKVAWPGGDSGEGEAARDPDGARRAWLESLPEAIDLRAELETLEQELTQRALRGAGGVQAEAARRLGVSRSDIAYKIKKHRPLGSGK